jgi:oxaloacetate decarboxylase alpha subunit
MEKQLRDQGAADSFDEVLNEIPRVRKDLGYVPLVTPTSQIVGTQSVLNVLLGERYRNITKETQAILRGEYGATPIPVDKDLQQRVLKGAKPITVRPADLLEPELQKLTDELETVAEEKKISLGGIDDVLTYALFSKKGLEFLENRGNPSAFEPPPSPDAAPAPSQEKAQPAVAASGGPEQYTVTVNGRSYDVEVAPGGVAIERVTPVAPARSSGAETINAPLAGSIFKILTKEGQRVAEGDVLMVLEAMKMETEIRAPRDCVIESILVKEGDTVELGKSLVSLA